jgi:cellulose synthase/poly-beta-1,6-N-acetylglucosamine synthase-like glycosyltransferase
MALSLKAAFAAASPRMTPRPVPLPSVLIYVAVAALWVLLFSRSFWLNSLWAWSAGIVYILYDTVLMAIVVWQTFPFRHAATTTEPGTSAAIRPTLGIIIAAHNEALNLPIALAAIFRQTDPPDVILIADDGSIDATDDLLKRDFGLEMPAMGSVSNASATAPSLRWMRLDHMGKAQALNAAIERIETDIVVTLDADTFLADDAVAETRKVFADNRHLVAAGGVLVPVCDSSATGHVMQLFQTYEYIRNIISRFAWMRMNSLLLISGAFAAFRRDALLTVGGFDPNCLVEDYELTHRMHRYAIDHGLPWQLRMVGSAVARTEAPSDIAAFMRQRRRWFAGFLQTQYWNRDMTGNRRYGALGKYMLPIKAIDTMQPIYGLTGFGLLVVFLLMGKETIAFPVIGIITVKIAADFLVYLWTVHLYRRLTGGRAQANVPAAAFAAIVEPFSFQLLRHAGAAWGWIAFIGGSNSWGFRERASPLRSSHDLPSAGE